jgi:hypothetical protein
MLTKYYGVFNHNIMRLQSFRQYTAVQPAQHDMSALPNLYTLVLIPC